MSTTTLDKPVSVLAQRPSALGVMASRFNVEPAKLLDTLKNTAFKGATDAQMMALCIVANEMGLNPFLREIYAFPDKQGGIVPVVGVDGWYNRMNAHPQFDGMEQEFVDGADGKPFSCTVTIHRKDRRIPTKHRELLSECFRNTDPWRGQPHRMLGHRAVIQCARKAFGFAGADPEEVNETRIVNGRVIEPFPIADSLPLATNGASAGPDAASPSNGAAGTDSPPAGQTATAANPPTEEGASSRGVASGAGPNVAGAEGPANDSARPCTTAVKAGDGDSPPGWTARESVVDDPAPPPATTSRGATPARRTTKAETLTLSDEPETPWQRFANRLKAEGIDQSRVESWLAKNSYPRLAMLAGSEVAEIEELWGALKEECKS